jgi:hypothetical protein
LAFPVDFYILRSAFKIIMKTGKKRRSTAKNKSPSKKVLGRPLDLEKMEIERMAKQYRKSKAIAFSLPEACGTAGPRNFKIVWHDFQSTKPGELSVDLILKELNGLISIEIDSNCYEIGRVRQRLSKEVIHTVACLKGALAIIGKYEAITREYRNGALVPPAKRLPGKVKPHKAKVRLRS